MDTAAQSLRRHLEAFSARAGYRKEGSIPASMTFRDWCEDLAKQGLKVDRKPFKLSDRPALVPIYDAIPTMPAEAFDRFLVVQKATQLGLTVWEVLADLYMALKWGPVNIGMFLPDQKTASIKSEHRFMTVVRSAPLLYRHMVERVDETGTARRIGEGNIMTRTIADSLLLFLWTSGKTSTESTPMDVVSLDEVQNMPLAQIDKVMARMGDSAVRFGLLLSTANVPDADINEWFQRGDMKVWHTECPTCNELSDLSDPAGIFPGRSIAYNTGQVAPAPIGRDGAPPSDPPINEYVWCCPNCRAHIPDPQHGRYVATTDTPRDPRVSSFMLPRTISPRITARGIHADWMNARSSDQKKTFYNRTLARPYIDADQLPVTMAHCMACVEEGRRLGLTWEKSGRDTFMGIDQMGGFNCVIIKKRLPDGRQGVVHVEVSFGEEPFERAGELMDQYGVAVCVVEQLPNVNSARRFANRYLRRVFLATAYTDLKDDMMRWGDNLSESDRRTSEEDRTRFTVQIHQYKAMQSSLYRVRDRVCLFPDPALLEQDMSEGGEPRRVMVLRDWVFHHFTKTALVVEDDPETRKKRPKVLKVGIDPHFSFANMLCDLAWARSYGTSTFIMPDNGPNQYDTDLAQKMAAAMPGLPQHVLAMVDAAPAGCCGSCTAFKAGLCTERDLGVMANDPGCFLYDAIERPGQS